MRVFFGLCFGLLLSANAAAEAPRLVVATTLVPYRYFIEQVGGERVEVLAVIPKGADPHSYELKPSQLKKIAGAALYVKTGTGVDFERTWMEAILSAHPALPVADASRSLTLLDKDPHVWLSVTNAKVIIRTIAEELTGADPAHAAYYEERRRLFNARLDRLHRELSTILEPLASKKVIVHHPAWTYFCKEYGIEQVAIEKEGKEPGPRSVARLVETAREEGLRSVFVSPQFAGGAARVIAREIRGRVEPIDPLAFDYEANLMHVARLFKESHASRP